MSAPVDVMLGGVGYNGARAIADTGEESLLIGSVGQDAFGSYALDLLQKHRLRHSIVTSPTRHTGVATLLYTPDRGDAGRALLISEGSASQVLPVDELPVPQMLPSDVLLLTGYSIFRSGTHLACVALANAARAAGAKIVVDLVPHELWAVGTADDLRRQLASLGAPFEICIGEDRTWTYLLGLTDEDTTHDSTAAAANPIARFCCIRYGSGHCEREALYYEGSRMYDADTAYLRQPVEGRRAYGDLLTARLVNSVLLGKQPYLFDPLVEFSISLNVLDSPLANVDRNCPVLDVGCGYGRSFDWLIEQGFGDITGIEPSQSLVDVARSRHPQIEVVHAAFEHWDTAPGQYGLVLLIGVLTCLHEDRLVYEFMSRASRALRPDGTVLVADFVVTERTDYRVKYDRYHRLFPVTPFGVFASEHGTINRHYAPDFLMSALSPHFSVEECENRALRTSSGGSSSGVVIRAKRR